MSVRCQAIGGRSVGIFREADCRRKAIVRPVSWVFRRRASARPSPVMAGSWKQKRRSCRRNGRRGCGRAAFGGGPSDQAVIGGRPRGRRRSLRRSRPRAGGRPKRTSAKCLRFRPIPGFHEEHDGVWRSLTRRAGARRDGMPFRTSRSRAERGPDRPAVDLRASARTGAGSGRGANREDVGAVMFRSLQRVARSYFEHARSRSESPANECRENEGHVVDASAGGRLAGRPRHSRASLCRAFMRCRGLHRSFAPTVGGDTLP